MTTSRPSSQRHQPRLFRGEDRICEPNHERTLTTAKLACNVPPPVTALWACNAIGLERTVLKDMKILGLTFRVDELSEDARDFAGTLDLELLSSVLPGLVGDLGYRPREDAQVSGQVYRSAQRSHRRWQDGDNRGVRLRTVFEFSSSQPRFRGSHTLLKRATPKDSSQEIVVSDDDEDDGALYYSGDEVNLTDLYRSDFGVTDESDMRKRRWR